ncbi:MAG: hypothetical protein AMJ90_00485 [candidate division Zixibacteria bacterium SM23_73_2]|nr:MAG: hypothetical protein AMJ90_00485 [candidate division Zixibacteria bacterium SM23_73_2]
MERGKVRIALDAMGGDFAPKSVVLGAIKAHKELADNVKLILVGDKGKVLLELSQLGSENYPFEVIHAPGLITMADSPVDALRRKKNSSISLGINLLKEGKADAFISGGNTGAVMASALFTLRRIEGVLRPAITTCLPSEKGIVVFLDGGANADCKPQNLFQFGVMGSIYANSIMKIKNPKVGLLSIGVEQTKGNELILESYKLFSNSCLNFVGNVEGRDVLKGTCDVVVCDGFVGNIVLKFAESFDGFLTSLVKKRVKESLLFRLGAFLLKISIRDLRRTLDYAEYGGAPLLGVDGVCIICHGGSSPKAIKNAAKLACDMVEKEVNKTIKDKLTQNSKVLKEINELND